MRLWPSAKRDWLLALFVAPLAVWLPIALLLLVGMQGATSRDPSTFTLSVAVTTVTAILLLVAVVGIQQFPHSAFHN